MSSFSWLMKPIVIYPLFKKKTVREELIILSSLSGHDKELGKSFAWEHTPFFINNPFLTLAPKIV